MADSTKDGPIDWVTVKTTLPKRPLPAYATREPVLTPRLLIRPVAAEDLLSIHKLRTQAEVMQWSSVGRVDADLAETQSKITPFLPPNDAHTFNFCIFLRETGAFVGEGGCHKFTGELGWPDIGYMFLKEHWGKGYASEFTRAFMEMWWALPREVCEVKVDGTTARAAPGAGEGEDLVEEMYIAITVPDNRGSQNVLEKAGFQRVRVWDEVDTRDPTGKTMETLLAYAATKPRET